MAERDDLRRFNDTMQLLQALRRTLKLASEYHLASAAEATLEAEMIEADIKRGRELQRAAATYSPPRAPVDDDAASDGNWVP